MFLTRKRCLQVASHRARAEWSIPGSDPRHAIAQAIPRVYRARLSVCMPLATQSPSQPHVLARRPEERRAETADTQDLA